MTMTQFVPLLRAGVAALCVLVAGCGTTPGNPSLNSVHQPVVERVTHTLDLTAPGGVLASGELARLDAWFSSLDLGYSDRVSIAAGCLDPPTGIRTVRQIWVDSVGDYYELDERIPSHPHGGAE